MKHSFKSLVLFMSSLTVSVLSGSLAFANTELGVLGGLNLGMNSFSTTAPGVTITTGSVSSFMFGAALHHTLQDSFGIEIDALYQKRGISVTGSGGGVSVTRNITVNYLTLPVMARFEVVPQYVRLGVGGYASLAISDVSVGDVSATRAASNWSSTDFGLIGSVRGSYPVAPNVDLVADVRYMFGFTDVDTTAENDSKLRDFSILAGASYRF